MLKKSIVGFVACCCLLVLAAPAWALPLVDLELGARYWAALPSGDLSYEGRSLDLEDNLGFDREAAPNIYASAGFAALSIDAHYTRLDYSGKGKDIPASTRFGDISDLSNYSDISTDAEVDMLHGGAMLSPPLPWLDLGVGAGVTYLDAETEIKADSRKETASASAPLPVAKARVGFSPPIIDLGFSVAGEGVTYSGNHFYDVRGLAEYTIQGLILGDLNLQAGYRMIDVDFDEEDLVLDTTFSGPFAGLSLSF